MALLALCFAGPWRPAAADPDAGQSIYHKAGLGLTPAVGITANGHPVLRSPEKFACAACHGAAGQGSAEAGIRSPPIDWGTLAAARTEGYGRPRPAYDPASLRRALLLGIDASGAPLGNAMPRYSMADAQFEALHRYLGRIGTPADMAPGVGPDLITLGTVLPMTGPLADIGEAAAAALRACFDALNAGGGIYGRRIELVVADSRGDPGLTVDAARRLVQDGHVFALVGSFLPGDHAALDAWLAEADVPLIGPLARAPREGESGPVWHLLPSLADQARILVDHARSAAGGPAMAMPLRAAIVHAGTPDAQDAARGAREQLASVGAAPSLDLMFDPDAFSAGQAARLAADAQADWVFFFGPADALEAFAERLPASPARQPMLGALTLLSPARRVPEALLARVVMAAPAVPEAGQLGKLAGLLKRSGHAVVRPALQAHAYAAASTLAEALTRCGRQISRAGFTEALEGLRSFDTGALPPITFGPNRHIGLRGASLLRIDPTSGLYAPLEAFRMPAQW